MDLLEAAEYIRQGGNVRGKSNNLVINLENCDRLFAAEKYAISQGKEYISCLTNYYIKCDIKGNEIL